MFRAHRAHHQERKIVSIQPLVAVGGRVVCRSEVKLSTWARYRVTAIRGCIDTICLSWWWARCARNTQRVKNINKDTENNCASRWSFTKNHYMMHGQQNKQYTQAFRRRSYKHSHNTTKPPTLTPWSAYTFTEAAATVSRYSNQATDRVIFPTKHQDRHWGPPSLLFNVRQEAFIGGGKWLGVKLTINLHLRSRFRVSGAILPLPQITSSRGQWNDAKDSNTYHVFTEL